MFTKPRKSSQLNLDNLRALIIAAILLSGSWMGIAPLLAASAPPGTLTNQATGSFIDEVDSNEVTLQSNTVQVTVLEIAGITVTAATPTEAPAGVTGAGTLQANGAINLGDIVYFDYTIANVGNDITKFFIPDAPSAIVGGTAGPLQIVSYDPDGTGPLAAVDLTASNITIPTGGADTVTLLGSIATANNGVIPVGGSIVVRVPVTVTATAIQAVTVTLGNTDGRSTTQNIAYQAGSKDLYTIDNADSVPGESPGMPINGDTTSHRQEASAIQSITVIGLDYGDAPDTSPTTAPGNYKTTLAHGGPSHIIVPGLSIGTNVDPDPGTLQSINADADNTTGTPNDEDGVASFPVLTTAEAQTYTVPVNITNTRGEAAYLVGYIDFNKDGDFDDPGEKSTTVTVAASGSQNAIFTTPAGMTAGNTYARFRLSSNKNDAESSIGAASDGEVEDYPVTISPATGPVIPSICSAAGGIRGTNLFINNGTFGTGSSIAGTTGTSLPPGRTTYNFQNYGSASPIDGNYAIVNQLNQNTFTGNWHNTFGHTTGAVNDQMMVVNASAIPGTFYTEILTVPPNQNIEFSAWILNLIKASSPLSSPIKPDISFVINRIGVDDNNNGTIDEPGEGQVITTSGLVPMANAPTWLNYGGIFNTGNATQIEYRLVNKAPGGLGNDLVLDDLFAAPCSPMPQGNITGTLYRDTNINNVYNSGTDGTMPANIAVNLKSATGAIVATAYTDASGNYNFTNVPAGSNYTIEVALADTDIPSDATATANPSGASTTGLQTGITVTSGATLANQNFGFKAVPIITTCPAGSISTGSGYATGGLGKYITQNGIFWLDWNCGGVVFKPGDVIQKSWTAPNGLVITAKLYDISQNLVPYTSGSYPAGDYLQKLYNGPSNTGLINQVDGLDPSYKIDFSATLNGSPIPADIATGEAESTDGPDESASWTTNGDAWQPIDRAATALDAQFSNGGKTLSMSDIPNQGFGSLVALTQNVSTINVNMNAGGKEAIAFGVMIPFDYGDAPASYGSAPHFARRNAVGGSQPTVLTPVLNLTLANLTYSTPYLGAIGPDPEKVALSAAPGSPATGDDNSGDSGVKDEDAFTSLPNVPSGGSYSLNNIPVNNTSSTAATLHAWVDFNKNGTFEATEYTSTNVANGATTANLNWASIPAGTTPGSTYARFRITTSVLNDDLGTANVDERSTLTANNGEVEDYQLSIAAPTPANVLLVKRITAINGISTGLTSFVDDVTTNPQASHDNNCNWLGATGSNGACTNTYTVGATSATAPKVKPGDVIEYTIYYLNAGNNKAKQVRICDRLDNNLTFKDETPTTPSTTASLSLQLVPGSGSIQPLTNLIGDDRGELTTPTAAGASCNLGGNTGTNLSNNVVLVDVATTTSTPATELMGSTGAGIPTTSYGLIRFKTTVK